MQSQAQKLGQKLIHLAKKMGVTAGDILRMALEAHLEAKKETEEEKIYLVSETEVKNRIRILGVDGRTDPTILKIYGVGWGGYNACHYVNSAFIVLHPENAHIFLTDIIKTGKTRDEYKEKYPGIPFLALIDQSEPWKSTSKVLASFEAFGNPDFGNCIELADHQIEGRIVFPWEKKQSPPIELKSSNFAIYQMIGRLATIMKICLPESAEASLELIPELETIQTWANRLMDGK